MIRQKFKDELDRLIGLQKARGYQPSWVRFAYRDSRHRCSRLTKSEWALLADASDYADPDWRVRMYDRQESQAFRSGLRHIDDVVKDSGAALYE
jgi:hypothetical protein